MHFYTGIAETIRYLAPEVRGQHIMQQLDALDLTEEFMGGRTPFGLPYSFSDYEMEKMKEH